MNFVIGHVYRIRSLQMVLLRINKSIHNSQRVSTNLGAMLLKILLFNSVFTSSPLPAQEIVPETAVDSIFARFDSPTSPGNAVAIMREGVPIYQRGYGMANLEYNIPIIPHSIFHIASISKHFTAMAVELLVNEGKLSWDDDIRKYVPEVPDFGLIITLRHLVHHVSGIRDQWSLLSLAGW